jgi:threonine dehydratase
MKKSQIPNLNEILKANDRIKGAINKTPVLTSRTVNYITNSNLFFKCENFQRVGAFKFRGASNKLAILCANAKPKAVATHSSGNHAAALALAARNHGLQCFVVMPENSPAIKVKAVKEYGAKIIYCKPNLAARESTLNRVVEKTNAVFVHPYNDFDIIAGQGTATLELLNDFPDLETIIAPVGGGGLLSGTSIAAKSIKPEIVAFGAEPAGADDAYRSLQENKIMPSINPKTIADGLLTSLGNLTFEAISKYTDEILTVSEDAIVRAMKLLFERMKLVVESSGCVPLAAILEYPEKFRSRKTGVILSGGNIDLSTLRSLYV